MELLSTQDKAYLAKKFLDEIYEVKSLKKEWKKEYDNLTKNFSDRKILITKF